MSHLNDIYFQLIHTENPTPNHGIEYQVYRLIVSTMVLFSKVNGAPLAGVSLMTWNRPREVVMSRAVILKRPDGQVDFQGLINEDNQKFEFVLTNFSSLGGIKIDIMKKNTAVQDTDPGWEKGGLNNVNELNPLQSSSIRGDQKDSRALILTSIKTAGGGNVTVKEAEKSKTPIGTYYWLAVTPRDDSRELIKLFAETYWDCVDFLVIPRVKEPVRHYYIRHSSNEEEESEEDQGRNEGPIMRLAGYDGPIPAAGPPQPRGDCYGKSKGIQPMSATRGGGYAKLASLSAPYRKTESVGEIVNKSLAANVASGEIVDTSSHKTGYSYFYDVPSNQTGKLCCLGLSVAPGLIFGNAMTTPEIVEAGKLLITDLKVKGAQALLRNIKIFPHDHCVICLDDETKPDMIFCQCGHSCCCSSCAAKLVNSKCPMCRGHISAMIKGPVS